MILSPAVTISFLAGAAGPAFRQATDPFSVADARCEDVGPSNVAQSREWSECWRRELAKSPWDAAFPWILAALLSSVVGLGGVVLATGGRRWGIASSIVFTALMLLAALALGVGSRVDWRHRVRNYLEPSQQISPAPDPARPAATQAFRACAWREGIRADVDGDGARDLVFHDWTTGGAVLAVCTAKGRSEAIPGAGQGELLEVVDLQSDGRDEILFGATSAVTRFVLVAVFRGGEFQRVRLPRGKPLLVMSGWQVDGSDGKQPVGLAFGCGDIDGDGSQELVQVTVERQASGFLWDREVFVVEGASAERVSVEAGRTSPDGDELQIAHDLVPACTVRAMG